MSSLSNLASAFGLYVRIVLAPPAASAGTLRLGALQFGDNVSGTVAADAAAADISTLNDGGPISGLFSLLQILKHPPGAGDVVLPAGTKLVGICAGRRVSLGTLNEGNAITVNENGYQELVQGVALCDAAVVVPGGDITGGAYDAWLVGVAAGS